MEITVKTQYDLNAMKALARGLRKTLRKKHSRRSHIFGWIVVVFGGGMLFSTSEVNGRFVVTALVMAMILLTFAFEDTLNAKTALKRGLPGLHSAVTIFDQEYYRSKTELGESQFYYENVQVLAETKDYFLLVVGPSHGQVYHKGGIQNGTEDDLRRLLEAKTRKMCVKV